LTKEYHLTEEHRAQLKPWADQWIVNALSTKPMDEEERAMCRDAAVRMYAAAGKTLSPDRVVFVPSPFIARFVTGFASEIWRRKMISGVPAEATAEATAMAAKDAIGEAVHKIWNETISKGNSRDTKSYWEFSQAIRSALRDANGDAIDRATAEAIQDAADEAAREAVNGTTPLDTEEAITRVVYDKICEAIDWETKKIINLATVGLVNIEIFTATQDAIIDAAREIQSMSNAFKMQKKWWTFPIGEMIKIDAQLGLGGRGIKAAQTTWKMWQGGNQWSGYDSFLSFFRHVVQLPIDYTNYDAWEILARHSGPRCAHEQFCIISDRPEIFVLDDQNRPHCETGPFCSWRDGSALYAIHGVYVPAWVVEHPEHITVATIDEEENAEIRRIMLERFGIVRYIRESQVEVRDQCPLDHPIVGLRGARLLYKEQINDEPLVYVEVFNPTPERDGSCKPYMLAVDPDAYNGLTQHSCVAAVASTWRYSDGTFVFDRPDDYAPIFES